MFVGVEVEEEVLHLFDDLLDSRVGAVDLVDDEHDGQSLLEGLAKDEPSLGQGTFGGVDERDDGVDHRQSPFDLAAEVGVTGRVDDVDGEVVPLDRGVLGEDGDALFAFQVAGVHDPVGQLLVRGEGPGLAQHFVHERGFSVVDVGDNGDISKGSSQCHGLSHATIVALRRSLRRLWSAADVVGRRRCGPSPSPRREGRPWCRRHARQTPASGQSPM